MAITKLVSPSVPNPTVSGAGGSWDLAMAQLTACKKMLSGEQMILTQWTNDSVIPALKLGSYLQHAGSIYVVDTADYSITAPTSDGTYYIKLAVSAETLAVSFISSLVGYSWNTQHNGLYDSANNQVLPYQIVRSGGNYAKRRILNPYHTSGFSTIDYLGNIICSNAICSNAIIAGHNIDSELDTLNSRVNQGVKTTDSPTFANATISGKFNGADIIKSPNTIIVSSFASPSAYPYGLTFDGTNLISCDYGSDRIYVHNGISSTILSSFVSPSTAPHGLTFDGTNLISCDSDSHMIYVHNGISSSILSSFASPGALPTGLAFDGTNLISCDSNSHMIYVHNGISSTILSSFVSPSTAPSGLAFDGTNLISCDSISHMIYVHYGISSSILSSFASPSTAPNGLAFDGTYLISCDSASDRIYKHKSELRFLL